jgi:RNA polymerase sigma factor (TIGR02999 family)
MRCAVSIVHDDVDIVLYDELRAIAQRRLRSLARGGRDATLNTTALVHEAYLKLAGQGSGRWNDRAHFLSAAAVAMRHILIDRARARASTKHGGTVVQVALSESALAVDDEPEALMEIDDALNRLAMVSARLANIVVLRFYGGLTDEEIAGVFCVTPRTVQRDWLKARMLLQRALAD